jgi:phosphate transport system permease protein
MSEAALTVPGAAGPRRNVDIITAGMVRRRAAERRFRMYGRIAIGLGLAFLVILFASIVSNGYTAFWQTHLRLDLRLDAAQIDPQGTRDPAVLGRADYGGVIKRTLR